MASIDKIRVNGASYNINLPTTATPSIASLTVSGGATITGELSTAGDTTLSKNLTVGRDTTISGSLSAATATVSQYLSVGESAAVSKNLTVGGSTTISGGYHKGYIRIYPTTPEYSPSILFHDDQNKLTTTLTQDLQNECFEVTAFGGSLILSAGLGHGIYFKEGANTWTLPNSGGQLITAAEVSDQTAESLSSAKAYTDTKTSTLSNTLTSYIDATKNEILSGTSTFNINTISASALKGGNPSAVTYQPNRGSTTSASGGAWVWNLGPQELLFRSDLMSANSAILSGGRLQGEFRSCVVGGIRDTGECSVYGATPWITRSTFQERAGLYRVQWRLTLSGSNGFSENRKDRKDFEFVFIPFGFLESTEGGGYFGVDTASGAPFVGAGNANNIKILSYDVSCYSGQLLPESPFFLSTYLMDTSVSYKLQDNTGVNLEPTFISPTTPSIVISVHTTSDQTIDKLGGLLINLLVYVGE